MGGAIRSPLYVLVGEGGMIMPILHELSLFSGYGGFSLGLRLSGLQTRTVAYVEWSKYPQEIIKARIKDGYLDDAPIFSDISAFRGEQFAGMVDIITAGFPCQPHSVAGLRQSAIDDRNLWPETLRVISEVAPRFVLLENVPGILSSSVDERTPAYGGTVVGELAQIGYGVHWRTIGADDVGAPHRRKRWWCIGVADSESKGRQRRGCGEHREPTQCSTRLPGWHSTRELADSRCDSEGASAGSEQGIRGRPQRCSLYMADSTESGLEGVGANSHQEGRQEPFRPVGLSSGTIPTWPPSPSDADGWAEILMERPDLAPALDKEAESQFRGMAHGATHRLDIPPANDRVNRLKALGNGIVPAVVAEFLHPFMYWERR